MSDISLTTKSVEELKDVNFFIPDYQRGYRWEKDEVTQLLDDIEEFANNPKGFYCLQPLVVVQQNDDKTVWEVIDGQQRLTTLFLILYQLTRSDNKTFFHIKYERHPEDQNGLAGLLNRLIITLDNHELGSPDFFYIKKANEAIAEWLKIHKEPKLSNLGIKGGPDIRFIWYQLAKKDSIPAFIRLNAGKIRLGDAELTRALFLRSDVPEAERLKLAVRWDQIERRFQEPEFWGFLSPKDYNPESRIELLFRQIAGEQTNVVSKWKIFKYFDDELKKSCDDGGAKKTRTELWTKIEDLFSMLEEWFETSDLFHLVGFLIECGIPLNTLVKNAEAKKDKNDFRSFLNEQIKNMVLPKINISEEKIKEYLKSLNYGKEIKTILLCLNLATLVNDKTGTVRFSFHAYKNEANGWDIEHIRATESRSPKVEKELKSALCVIKDYAENVAKRREPDTLYAKIVEKLNGYAEKTNLEELQNLYQAAIQDLDGDEIGASNDISNLTLLDAETNRGYGNSPFQVKRGWILGLDSQAKYILPCTRNVFNKGYSCNPKHLLRWTKDDAWDYLDAMSKTLFKFFSGSKGV